ncbi:helix-turn-helix domain-containing protein [Nonomuraea mesophila]
MGLVVQVITTDLERAGEAGARVGRVVGTADLGAITIPVSGYRVVAMVRPPLTPEERLRGEQLGSTLRQARGERSIVEVAAAAGMSAETLRKIETGRIATPAFFTIAALADVLDISLDHLVVRSTPAPT